MTMREGILRCPSPRWFESAPLQSKGTGLRQSLACVLKRPLWARSDRGFVRALRGFKDFLPNEEEGLGERPATRELSDDGRLWRGRT